MGIAQVIQLVLGLVPLVTQGIAAIRVVATGGTPGNETYDVFIVSKDSIKAADRAEVNADKTADQAVIAQVGG
jgi:hypothetical protein